MGDFVDKLSLGSMSVGMLPPEVDAGGLVQAGWDSTQALAQSAVESANALIAELSGIGDALLAIPDVTAEVGAVNHSISGFVMPDGVTRPDLTTQFPANPNEPTLSQVSALNLPNAPEFTQNIPSGVMAYVEPGYVSALQTSIKSFLQQWIDGFATGLDPDVEQAIWDRARAREDVNAIRASDVIRSNMAGRGFPVPPGAMNVALLMAQQEAIDKNSSLSRDIAIKQAELEQANRHFAITTGVQFENQLLTYANQMAQRIYEVAAANLRGAIDLYQTTATVYSAQTNGYAALTTALIAQQNAEIKVNQELPLELFKSRVTAFDSLVKSESARLGAISAMYETEGRVYASEAQAEGSKAGAEADIYKAEVQYVLGAANVQIEVAKANVAKMTTSVQLLEESLKAGVMAYTQMASSSLSAVNLSGSISAGTSQGTSVGYSIGNSTSRTINNSLNESHSYDETKG